MRKAILILFLISICKINGQLPKEMYYSEDGKILYTGGQDATGLYDITDIKDVYLDFQQSNYWSLLTNNYASETLINATMTYDETIFSDVGVRFRGNTSYMMIGNSPKKSFKVEMDFTDENQELFGYKSLKFNNAHQDPTFMREVLYGNMAKKYMPIAKGNYIHLYLNNEDWGIYPNIQSIDKTFLKEWFLSNDGARFRATTDNNGGGGGGGGPNWGDGTAALNDLGTNITTYQNYYSLKSSDITDSWQKLVDVCQVLDNATSSNKETTLAKLDVDKALWFLAAENIFTDDDSYIMKGKMDYMIYYEPETDRVGPLEYDGNSTFVINDATSNNWGPFKNVNNANYPLLNKLLNIPEWRQRYLAHYRTILNETFTTANATTIVNQLDALIATEVANDPKKLYSTNQYTNGVPQIISFVTNRRNFLFSNTEVAQNSPTIATAKFYNSNMDLYTEPAPNEVVNIKAEVSSGNGITNVYLYYATGLVGNFTKVQMYDDGNHNDDAQNDGVYGAEIIGYDAGTTVRYYVEAIANNTSNSASYLPVGAEHDVFVYKVMNNTSPNGVVINELMASNSTTVVDEIGDYDDWVELYNTNDFEVDLSDFYLTDDSSSLDKWQIPTGTIIAENGYLIIWCDNDVDDGPLHASFKLSSGGESAILSNNSLSIVDQVDFGTQTTDMGYARVPNGTGPFVIQSPTYNSSNDTVVNVDELNLNNEFVLYPNPTDAYINISFTNPNLEKKLQIYSSLGQKVFETQVKQQMQIDVNSFSSGVYFVQYQNTYKKFIVK